MVARIYMDLEQVDLNVLFEKFHSNNIDFCLANEVVYIHYSNYRNNNPVSISYIMKELNIDNFYYKEIKEKPDFHDGNFIHQWCYEKIEQDIEEKLNIEEQEALKQMMDSIEKCKKLLKNKSNKEEK